MQGSREEGNCKRLDGLGPFSGRGRVRLRSPANALRFYSRLLSHMLSRNEKLLACFHFRSPSWEEGVCVTLASRQPWIVLYVTCGEFTTTMRCSIRFEMAFAEEIHCLETVRLPYIVSITLARDVRIAQWQLEQNQCHDQELPTMCFSQCSVSNWWHHPSHSSN
jgi:hypothetical protein